VRSDHRRSGELALYSTDGLTIGNSFPGGTIPANLIDPNAVLFMKTGAIPAVELDLGQRRAAVCGIADAADVCAGRRGAHRSRHHGENAPDGHFIHDQMSQTYYPDMWSSDSIRQPGTCSAIRRGAR